MVWFYREAWNKEFRTSPCLPKEEVKRVVEKFKEEIDGASAGWGEVEFLYDGDKIYPWKSFSDLS